MALDNRVRSLIAVGASVSANCQPCLERTVSLALKEGATAEQIAEAIGTGSKVRQGAASKLDAFAARLPLTAAVRGAAVDQACGCEHTSRPKPSGAEEGVGTGGSGSPTSSLKEVIMNTRSAV